MIRSLKLQVLYHQFQQYMYMMYEYDCIINSHYNGDCRHTASRQQVVFIANDVDVVPMAVDISIFVAVARRKLTVPCIQCLLQ